MSLNKNSLSYIKNHKLHRDKNRLPTKRKRKIFPPGLKNKHRISALIRAIILKYRLGFFRG